MSDSDVLSDRLEGRRPPLRRHQQIQLDGGWSKPSEEILSSLGVEAVFRPEFLHGVGPAAERTLALGLLKLRHLGLLKVCSGMPGGFDSSLRGMA